MGNPITWQNVNQGDASTAWRAMDSAQRSFNGAFDDLGSILKGSEEIQAKNDVAIKNNNTQDFLNKVSQLGKTPEQLAAAIANGDIDRLKSGYGNAINHDVVRGAAEGLLDQRFKQARTATEFGNFMLDEKTAPIMDKFKTAMIAGDKEGMERYRGEYAKSGGKHGVDLEVFARNMLHENDTWDEQKKGWVRDQGMHEAKLADMLASQQIAKGQLAVSQGQLGVAQSGLQIQRENLQMTKDDRYQARLGAAIEGLGKVRAAEAGSAEGTAAMFNSISETFKGDPNGMASARAAFGKILEANPKISTADAMQAVLTQDNSRWYKINGWVEGNTGARAEQLAATDASRERTAQTELQKAAALERYANLRAQDPAAKIRAAATPRNPVVAPVTPAAPPVIVAPPATVPAPVVPVAPVVVPPSGATVAPKSEAEAQVRANEEKLKASLAAQFAKNRPPDLTPAELKAKKKEEERKIEGIIARASGGNSSK